MDELNNNAVDADEIYIKSMTAMSLWNNKDSINQDAYYAICKSIAIQTSVCGSQSEKAADYLVKYSSAFWKYGNIDERRKLLLQAKFIGKDGKEHIGGIPDFQFVPSQYSYEKPCKANAFVEFKCPLFSDEGVYVPLKYKKTPEIEHEFEKCDKIIFTDGISWYFLEKQQIDVPENPE